MQVYIICRLCTVFCILCSQLVLNCIHGKADEALSFWFLLQWFAGDSTNLVGALLTHQLTTQVSTILSAVFCSYSHQTCFCMVAAIPIKHVSVLWQLFPSNMFLYCGSYSHQTCVCIVAAIPIKHVPVLWQLLKQHASISCHCTRSSFLLPLLYWEQCSLFYALCVDWFINGEDMTVCI